MIAEYIKTQPFKHARFSCRFLCSCIKEIELRNYILYDLTFVRFTLYSL